MGIDSNPDDDNRIKEPHRFYDDLERENANLRREIEGLKQAISFKDRRIASLKSFLDDVKEALYKERDF